MSGVNYDESYAVSLKDQRFLYWRELGARQKIKNVLRMCRDVPVSSVIEIGCGTGAVIRGLQSVNFAQKYAFIDVAISAVRFTRDGITTTPSLALVSSATSLPFRGEAFDLAILSHVLEHLEDPVSAVREACRIAQLVIIEVPTEKVFSNFLRTKICGKAYASVSGAGHVQFWSERSIIDFLRIRCCLDILKHHQDLLSDEVEFYEKEGADWAKPAVKKVLKYLLPGSWYSRLFTTHAVFLCQRQNSTLLPIRE
jgi:ubiquinone/menaquinone biosynthesis C-methylase UbiE